VTCSGLRLNLGIFATTRPNFNYFGHFHNYDATIKNFIVLVELILHLFSSINQFICPISHSNHQINCILKVFYNDIWVYFNACNIYIYISIHMYIVHIMNLNINIWILNFLFKSENWYFNSKLLFWILHINTSTLKILIESKIGHFNFEYCYFNLKIDISILDIVS